MKKHLAIFFILIFLCSPIITKAIATNSSYNDINIYFFYYDNSKDCTEARKWIEEKSKDNNRIRIEYISIKSNKKLYNKTKNALNVKKDDVPLIVIGTNYFIGSSNKVKDNLIEAIDSYKEADDYCDAVSKIQKNEDIKSCIKQNKDIYNQENIIFIIVKILVLLIVISLVIILLNRFKIFNKLTK